MTLLTLSSDNRAHTGAGATTTGAYASGAHNTYGTTSTNAGPHNSNMLNKVDPRIDSDMDNRARHETMGGAHGPHGSSIANKMDPRVDSDMDNRGAYGTTTTHGTAPETPSAPTPAPTLAPITRA